jgi:stearoyl-CoA desaturase (delta-9 desaturase)
MFTMSKGWEKTFMFLSYIFQGSSYLSPRAYGILHRMHHANADTEKDVHSPKHVIEEQKPMAKWFGFVWMMAETARIYDRIDKGFEKFKVNIVTERNISVPETFKKNLPYYPKFDSWGQSLPSRLMWGSSYVLFYIFFAQSWVLFLLLPIHFLMGPVHGLIINWFAHRKGYRNYKTKDTSVNLPIPMLGENLHNNHHGEPANANFARNTWELDLTYQVMRLMHWAGIIQLKLK